MQMLVLSIKKCIDIEKLSTTTNESLSTSTEADTVNSVKVFEVELFKEKQWFCIPLSFQSRG